jgi:hypothetical protein
MLQRVKEKSWGNKDLAAASKSFRGKKFSAAEKQAIFNRIGQLIRERVQPETMVTVLNAEGFRRVDGTQVTLSWVTSRMKKVKESYKDKVVIKRSGPVKEIYKRVVLQLLLPQNPLCWI